jgi:hypothetical protein
MHSQASLSSTSMSWPSSSRNVVAEAAARRAKRSYSLKRNISNTHGLNTNDNNNDNKNGHNNTTSQQTAASLVTPTPMSSTPLLHQPITRGIERLTTSLSSYRSLRWREYGRITRWDHQDKLVSSQLKAFDLSSCKEINASHTQPINDIDIDPVESRL